MTCMYTNVIANDIQTNVCGTVVDTERDGEPTFHPLSHATRRTHDFCALMKFGLLNRLWEISKTDSSVGHEGLHEEGRGERGEGCILVHDKR